MINLFFFLSVFGLNEVEHETNISEVLWMKGKQQEQNRNVLASLFKQRSW